MKMRIENKIRKILLETLSDSNSFKEKKLSGLKSKNKLKEEGDVLSLPDESDFVYAAQYDKSTPPKEQAEGKIKKNKKPLPEQTLPDEDDVEGGEVEKVAKKEWYVLLPNENGQTRTHKDPLTRDELIDIVNQQENPGQVLVWRLGDPDEWRTAGSYGIAASNVAKKETFDDQYANVPCVLSFETAPSPQDPSKTYYRATVTLEGTNKTSYAYFTPKQAGQLKQYVAIISPYNGQDATATYECVAGNVMIKGTISKKTYKISSVGYTKEDLVRKLAIIKNDNKFFGLPLYAVEGDDTLDVDVVINATELMINKINDNYRGSAIRRFGSLLNHLKDYYTSTQDTDTLNTLEDLINRFKNAVKNINGQYNNISQQSQSQTQTKEQTKPDEFNISPEELDSSTMTEHRKWLSEISGKKIVKEQGKLSALMKQRGLTPKEGTKHAPESMTQSYGSAAKKGMMVSYNVLSDPLENEMGSYDTVEINQGPFTQPFTLYKYQTMAGGDYSLQNFKEWLENEGWDPADCDTGLQYLMAGATGRYSKDKIVSGLGGNDTLIRKLKFQVCKCRAAGHYKNKKQIENLDYLGNLNDNPKFQIDCSEIEPEKQPRKTQ